MREEEIPVPDTEKIIRQRKRAGSGYSRSRWNSMKHGLAANTVVVPGEDPAAFDRLLAEYIEEWNPGGPTQARLVRELAIIDWKLTRYARAEQAYHRQTMIAGYAKVSPALGGGNVDEEELKLTRKSVLQGSEGAILGQIIGDPHANVEPESHADIQEYIRRLLDLNSGRDDSLVLAIFHLPPKFQELWKLAIENPAKFARFRLSINLPEVAVKKADWPSFKDWVNDFALPYLEALHGAHDFSRDYNRHVTELLNISAMEGLASVWRYEDRLHNQRKNALAMLLRLQGK